MSSFVNLLDIIFPAGSLYFSVNAISPSSLIGGTWQQIKGAVLAASGKNNFSTAGNYGGNLKITVDQIPPHTHLSGDVYLANFGGSDNSHHTFAWEKNSMVQAESSSTGGGAKLFALSLRCLYLVQNRLNVILAVR